MITALLWHCIESLPAPAGTSSTTEAAAGPFKLKKKIKMESSREVEEEKRWRRWEGKFFDVLYGLGVFLSCGGCRIQRHSRIPERKARPLAPATGPALTSRWLSVRPAQKKKKKASIPNMFLWPFRRHVELCLERQVASAFVICGPAAAIDEPLD